MRALLVSTEIDESIAVTGNCLPGIFETVSYTHHELLSVADIHILADLVDAIIVSCAVI